MFKFHQSAGQGSDVFFIGCTIQYIISLYTVSYIKSFPYIQHNSFIPLVFETRIEKGRPQESKEDTNKREQERHEYS